ncbi:hypothetical protein IJ750_03615 [bacterium]|nr:hypothetical protein [bacterium]MBR1776145.1 hypothetical protein [bacterium]
MYIVEIFVKWLNKNKRGKSANPQHIYKEGIMLDEEGNIISEQSDDALHCEHNFMPVDSTGTVLACTKCGFVIKKK